MLKRASGFTIIELLIVMVIISVLSVLVLTNYRSGQKKYALDQAAQKLVSDIRKAQNMAMSGVEITGVCDEDNCTGYGIYINKNDTFYIIYADNNGNLSRQPSDATVETINLSSKIKIDSVSPLSNRIDMFFESPAPTARINFPIGTTLGTITLGVVDSSLTKTITVTTAGLIYSN